MRYYYDSILPNLSLSSEISMTNYFCFGAFDRRNVSDNGGNVPQFS